MNNKFSMKVDEAALKSFGPIREEIKRRQNPSAGLYERILEGSYANLREMVGAGVDMPKFDDVLDYIEEQRWIQKSKEDSLCVVRITSAGLEATVKYTKKVLAACSSG